MVARFEGIHALVVAHAAVVGAGEHGLGIVMALVTALKIDLCPVVRLVILMTEFAGDFARLKKVVVFFMIEHFVNGQRASRRPSRKDCNHHHRCQQ